MEAIKVIHEKFGEGTTIPNQHSEVQEDGYIEFFDVMFEHGIEKGVRSDDLEELDEARREKKDNLGDEEEADSHIHVQLKTAADSHGEAKGKEGYKLKGGADVKFESGKHFVASHHAKHVVDSLERMKPDVRARVHDHIRKSHENFKEVHKMLGGKE